MESARACYTDARNRNPLLLAGIHSLALSRAGRKGWHGTPDLTPPQARPSRHPPSPIITHHHSSPPTITHHHSSPLIRTLHHPPSLIITHHHSSSLILTHHHSSSLITTHHHSSPLIFHSKIDSFSTPFLLLLNSLGGGGSGGGSGPTRAC